MSTETTLPATAATAETETDLDEEDVTVVSEMQDHLAKVQGRADNVTSEAFLAKLKDAKGVRAELRDWIYPFLVKTIELGGQSALDVEDLQDQIEEVKEVVDRLGNLMRAVASTNYFALVQHLITLVLTRSQDPETLGAAQSIAVLYAGAAPVMPTVPTVAAPPVDPTTPPAVG